MAQIFKDDESYRKNVAREADSLIIKHNKTPKGLLFNPEISKWGSLRYASNWAYFLLGAARLDPPLPNHKVKIPSVDGSLFLKKKSRNITNLRSASLDMHLAIRDDLLLLVSGKIHQTNRIIALHHVLQGKIGKNDHVFVRRN